MICGLAKTARFTLPVPSAVANTPVPLAVLKYSLIFITISPFAAKSQPKKVPKV